MNLNAIKNAIEEAKKLTKPAFNKENEIVYIEKPGKYVFRMVKIPNKDNPEEFSFFRKVEVHMYKGIRPVLHTGDDCPICAMKDLLESAGMETWRLNPIEKFVAPIVVHDYFVATEEEKSSKLKFKIEGKLSFGVFSKKVHDCLINYISGTDPEEVANLLDEKESYSSFEVTIREDKSVNISASLKRRPIISSTLPEIPTFDINEQYMNSNDKPKDEQILIVRKSLLSKAAEKLGRQNIVDPKPAVADSEKSSALQSARSYVSNTEDDDSEFDVDLEV